MNQQDKQEEIAKNWDWNGYLLMRYYNLDDAHSNFLYSQGMPDKGKYMAAKQQLKSMIALYFSELIGDFGAWLNEGKITEAKEIFSEEYETIKEFKPKDYLELPYMKDTDNRKLHLLASVMKFWEQTHGSKNNKREIRDPGKAIQYG